MTWSALLYEPVYTAFGVPVAVVLANDDAVELVGLDKTAGVEVQLGGIDVPTVRPAVAVRMADVTELGLTAGDFQDAVLEMNGVSWRVYTTFPRASPYGVADGELYMILTQGETT